MRALRDGFLRQVEVERTVRWRRNDEPLFRLALDAGAGRPLFSPRDAVEQLKCRRREARGTPLWDSYEARYERDLAAGPDRADREAYDAGSFGRAVQRGIARANVARVAKGLDPVPRWHVYKLRNSAATCIRAEHGIEAVRTLLGHASATVTEVYAEADPLAAAKVAESADPSSSSWLHIFGHG